MGKKSGPRSWAAALLCSFAVAGAWGQSPGSVESLLKYGREYFDAGKPDMAAMYFRQAASAFPRNAEAQFRLGQALLAMNKPEEARVAFDRAATLDPTLREPAAQLLAQAVQAAPPRPLSPTPATRPPSPTAEAPRPPAPQPPPAPARSGGGELAFGDYVCTQASYSMGGAGRWQRREEPRGTLTLQPGGVYQFRGSAGRYQYEPATGDIRWTAGYLAADTTSTRYRRNQRTTQVDITFRTASGNLDWICGHNLP